MHNIMIKITGLCLAVIASVSAFSAYAQEKTTVTLNMTDVPVSQVIREIEQKTEFVFLNKDVDVSRHVTINMTDRPVSDVLDFLFKDNGVDYKIEAMHIVISNKVPKTVPGGGGNRK